MAAFWRRSIPRQERSIAATEVRDLIAGAQRPVVLEIGCNDGGDTLRLAGALPAEARIHCFECDERALARFRQRSMPPNVTLHAFAVGAADGRAVFHESGGGQGTEEQRAWDLSGSLRRPTGHRERYKWCAFENAREVEVRALDGWFAAQALEGVDFVWMDVQGAEGDVLAGGRATLERTRYVYTEFNDWKRPLYEGDLDLNATLKLLGPSWEAVAIYGGNNLLARNRAPGAGSAPRG